LKGISIKNYGTDETRAAAATWQIIGMEIDYVLLLLLLHPIPVCMFAECWDVV